MNRKLVAICSILGLAAGNAMASCYTVYDRANQVVYNAETPPVDMSRPLHETLPGRFPGGHMVFGEGGDCPKVNVAGLETPIPNRRAVSPLLTDRKTADAMNAPRVMLSGNIALVDQRAATAPLPAFEVPAAEVVAVAQPRRTGTVITEMRDPPMTVVQSAAGVVITEHR